MVHVLLWYNSDNQIISSSKHTAHYGQILFRLSSTAFRRVLYWRCGCIYVYIFFECCRWTRDRVSRLTLLRDEINALVPRFTSGYIRPNNSRCTLPELWPQWPRFIAAEKLESMNEVKFTRCWCVLDDRTEKCDYSMTNWMIQKWIIFKMVWHCWTAMAGFLWTVF